MVKINKKVEGFISGKDVIKLIEDKIGYRIYNISYNIHESGDFDRGTYKVELKGLDFLIDESKPVEVCRSDR